MGFEFTRSQWTLQHDVLRVVPEYGDSEEEESESSDEGSKPSMPILMYDSKQFGKVAEPSSGSLAMVIVSSDVLFLRQTHRTVRKSDAGMGTILTAF